MFKYSPFLIFVFLVLNVSLQSCSYTLSKIYGIESISEFNKENYEKTIDEFSLKYKGEIISKISDENLFTDYSNTDTTFRSYNKQPIQILYFDDDDLTSFHANCFAKGSISGNLDWNYNDQFSTFYPKSAIPVDDKKTTLSSIKHLYKIEEKTTKKTVVFFWTNMLKKQSISAFDLVINNIHNHVDEENLPTIITINTDYFFMEKP